MAAIMRERGKPSRENRLHSGDFCADRIGLTSYQVCPDASWSKHNDTTIYMRFIQFFFAARLGRFWVQACGALARQFYAAKLLRFPLHSKLHYLDHSYRFLQYHVANSEYVYNILNESVQQDEDFVGQQARLSRRVSPVTNSYRSLERYCARARKIWG
ncbi:unnamed protein product [Symbiodinium pilosum]|uniref:Uncharacterized protein n=1 Tax=Symbiodinium pilosum TaxID=2952 RepID=A0A812VVI8_SYMPI|nr:unnamed protein product [Symbiodinium pilosum]